MNAAAPPRLPPLLRAPGRVPLQVPGRVDDPPAGPFDGDDGDGDGGGNDWVAVTRAANDIEAHLVVGRLCEANIETIAMKDQSGSVAWLHGGSDPWSPVLVLVRRLQFEDARIVLAEVAFEAPSASITSRAQTSTRGGWRGPLVWWTLALGLGIFLSALSYVGTKETLEQCRRDGTCLIPPERTNGDR